jgi:hypothetical protein
MTQTPPQQLKPLIQAAARHNISSPHPGRGPRGDVADHRAIRPRPREGPPRATLQIIISARSVIGAQANTPL